MGEEKKYSYGKIKHFADIEAWKLARKLRIEIYGIIRDGVWGRTKLIS